MPNVPELDRVVLALRDEVSPVALRGCHGEEVDGSSSPTCSNKARRHNRHQHTHTHTLPSMYVMPPACPRITPTGCGLSSRSVRRSHTWRQRNMRHAMEKDGKAHRFDSLTL